MTKECPVILNNAAVTVVEYDTTLVQLPAINKQAAKIHVSKENGKYTVVEEAKTEVKETKKASAK